MGMLDSKIRFALEVPVIGWAALAIGDSMLNAEAVIGGGSKDGGPVDEIKAYKLSSYDFNGDGVVEDAIATAGLSETSVLQENGKTKVTFTRPLDNGGSAIVVDADTPFLFSYGLGSTIQYHEGNRDSFRINLATGTAKRDNVSRNYKIIHGALMLLSWGGLIPMGSLMAAWGGPRFKVGSACCFKAHRAVQSLGLLISIAGVAYAMYYIYAGQLNQLMQMPLHGLIGVGIMFFGIMQPINACMRPHGAGFGRRLWELAHKSLGRVATMAGLLNCVFGAMIARQQHVGEEIFPLLVNVSMLVVAAFTILYILARLAACLRAKRMADSEDEPCAFQPDVERPSKIDIHGLPEETSQKLDMIFDLFERTSQAKSS